MVQDLAVALLHLLEGVGRIKGGNGHVAAVDDAQVLFVRVDAPYCVVGAAFLLARRARSDASGSEAGA